MKEHSFLGLGAASSPVALPAHLQAGPPPVWAAMVGGLHRISYVEWGSRGADRTVVCVHGMARNGRDFDTLAQQLSSRYRVICPDMPGRGRSAWLTVAGPDGGYNFAQYLLDMTALIARLDVPQVDWIGTSMGGVIGMMLAAQPESPIRRLVMNDTGPVVPATFADYLSTYISADPDFDTLDQLEAYLRTTYAAWGQLSDAQWRQLAEHSHRRKQNGKLGLGYDPAIGKALKPPFSTIELWPFWGGVKCPVLVLRGESSTLLSPEVADRMAHSGPKTTVVEIPGCGHAPSLMAPEQIALIETWLETGQVH
jgi:pimeloyl-ACP methyl ester carboxylesterase